jgi:hypothetical protein
MSTDRGLTKAKSTFSRLSRARAPILRRVAVFYGLERRGVISTCIVSGPAASFRTLDMHRCHVWLTLQDRVDAGSFRAK